MHVQLYSLRYQPTEQQAQTLNTKTDDKICGQ
jgi:hypothetical protein